jgi:hypothetical protein
VGKRLGRILVVLDQQDAQSARRPIGVFAGGRDGCARAAAGRQANAELAAAAQALAPGTHLAAVHLDQGADQREADAQAAVRAIGRGRGLEEQVEAVR